MLNSLSYSSLQSWAECRYAWFGHYILGLESQPSAAMVFGKAIDEALSASNQNKLDTDSYLQPEIVVPIFRDSFESSLPEENSRPSLFSSALDYFWRGDDAEAMLADGEELLRLYYAKPWAEPDDDFLPLHSAGQISPDGVQLRLELPLPGDHVNSLIGILDLLDDSGVVVDYKARKRAGSWDTMDFDLQPTTYATLLGRPTTLQFIELIRGDKRCSIRSHATHRTETDIERFLAYVQITGREIDTAIKMMTKELGAVESWKEDPEAVRLAAGFFPPSPGRRCAFEGHFVDCMFRAGGPPDDE